MATMTLVIFGGEDHKTGQVSDTSTCYERLEQTLRTRVPEIQLTHRWSGQVIETPDGLPYIGKMADHQYVATGFGGNGMTFGTLAGDHDRGCDPGPEESVGRSVRAGAIGDSTRAVGLHQGERGLPVLQDARPLRG